MREFHLLRKEVTKNNMGVTEIVVYKSKVSFQEMFFLAGERFLFLSSVIQILILGQLMTAFK